MSKESKANRKPSFRSANGRAANRRHAPAHAAPRAIVTGHQSAPAQETPPPFSAADLLPFVNALGRHWKWLLVGGLVMAGTGFAGGLALWQDSYTASAQLLRQTSAHVMAAIGDREMEPNTYASLLRAPELLQRVASQASPPLPPESLARSINITPERDSEVLLVAISGSEPQRAVDLANLYSREAVKFTQELQTNSAARVRLFLARQISPLEAEIIALSQAPSATNKQPAQPTAVRPASASPAPFLERLQSARLELVDFLSRYTDQHPSVRQQRAKIAAIERELQQMPAELITAAEDWNAANRNGAPLTQPREHAFMQAKLQSLENARLSLLAQNQAAASVETHPPGTCQVLAPAILKEVISHRRRGKVAVLTGFGGVFGFLLVGALILVREAADPRLKTAADVKRVTHLPVLASAGDLAGMTEAEQKNWAFRAWTNLQGSLSPSSNQGFVCGITSSEHGEGRSMWIRLLAEAASQCGFRVLTVVARPSERDGHTIVDSGLPANECTQLPATRPVEGNGALVAGNVLNAPDEVTQKLIGPNPEPVVQIPLPGWVWNLERRKQWHAALRHWSQIDNIALLVELPPASMPETVLLAENLPNLIWLADCEKAKAARTCEQLETLRSARCHLAGAVLNHAPASFLKLRLARWFGSVALLVGLHSAIAHSQAPRADACSVAVNPTAGADGLVPGDDGDSGASSILPARVWPVPG